MLSQPPFVPSVERLRRVSYGGEHVVDTAGPADDVQTGGPRVEVHYVRDVVVLVVIDELTDALEELDLTLQRALVEEPRGVVCDVSAAGGRSIPRAQLMMDRSRWHLGNWAGTPVVVGCPHPVLRRALRAAAKAGSPVVAESVPLALSEVFATPERLAASIRLDADSKAPYAARTFISRALREWRLGHLTFNACLVAGELVTNAVRYAGPHIDVSLAAHDGAVRVSVRDQSPEMPRPRLPMLESGGRGLLIVGRLSSAWGVVPGDDGGKVVWAVLRADRSP